VKNRESPSQSAVNAVNTTSRGLCVRRLKSHTLTEAGEPQFTEFAVSLAWSTRSVNSSTSPNPPSARPEQPTVVAQVAAACQNFRIIADRGHLEVEMKLPGISQHVQAQPTAAPLARLTDPLERLARSGSDNSQPGALRHETQTVLTLYQKRRDDLDARDAGGELEVTTFSRWTIVPCSKGIGTLQKVRL
jgi:hypothetical protein